MKLMKLFAPLIALLLSAGMLSAQGDYQIRPGDTLVIEVLEDSSLNRAVAVLPNGQINFPYAGSVAAQGRTVSEVEGALRSGISSNFASPPTVFVTVQPRQAVASSGGSSSTSGKTIDVFFLGEVNKPGAVQVKRGTTLLQAMAVSGGVSKFAATKRIQLRREGTPDAFTINYKALSNGSANNDIELKDGDVILVPERRLFE